MLLASGLTGPAGMKQKRSFTITELARITGIPRRTLVRHASKIGAFRNKGSKVWRVWNSRHTRESVFELAAEQEEPQEVNA